MTTLGFVGLGHMGGNMAARFLAAGYTVYGESRDRRHADDLLHQGLQWRDTPRDIAETVDVVITSVPDDAVLESVASEPDGILAGLTEGKVWVDMSTVNPRTSPSCANSGRRRTSARTARDWCSSSRSTSASPCKCSPSPRASFLPIAQESTANARST